MVASERIVVTGASRGLGLEFCRQWARDKQVAALTRDPDGADELRELAGQSDGRITVHACDVTADDSTRAAASEVEQRFDSVDLIVNNAGVAGRIGQSFEELDLDDVRATFEANTLGPLRVVRAFLPLLRRGRGKLIANITSLMGSIGDNSSGGWWGYRISKAALNMANKNLALALDTHGISSLVLHPGWVRTDMGGEMAPLSVEESVRSMVATLVRIGPAQSGQFLDRDGDPCPW